MENQYKNLQNNIYSMISIFVKKKKIYRVLHGKKSGGIYVETQ